MSIYTDCDTGITFRYNSDFSGDVHMTDGEFNLKIPGRTMKEFCAVAIGAQFEEKIAEMITDVIGEYTGEVIETPIDDEPIITTVPTT